MIKTSSSYWLIQDYDSDSTLTLAAFLQASRDGGSELVFTYEDMRSLCKQLVGAMQALHVQSKFVHGNLDSQAVYIDV